MLEIGNTLREARMRRNLDIIDCEAATKIRGKYLRALEEEQFEMLPGPTYVRGFLRTYSDHLGLDGRLVVEQYESQFERPREQTAYEEHLRRNRSRRRSREGRVLVVVALVVMLGSVAVWVARGTTGSSTPSETTRSTENHASVELGFLTHSRGVEVRIHKDSESGQQIVAPVRLSPGRAEELTAAPPVWIGINLPGAVSVSVDGRAVSLPAGVNAFRVVGPGQVEPLP